jgi:hypothetical protein
MNTENNKKCICCGEILDASASFCFNCGTKVENAPSQSKNICAACGEKLHNEAVFCMKCGAKVETTPQSVLCSQCGEQMPENSFFCFKCGFPTARQNISASNSFVTSTQKTVDSAFIKNVIKKSVVLIVSILMIVFAFLPVMSYNFMIDEEKTVNVGISAIDNVIFAFDSLNEYENFEDDSNLYYQASELEDEIKEYLDSDNRYDFRIAEPLVEKSFHLGIRLNLRYSQEDTQPIYWVTATISLIYVVSAVLLFLFAATDLINCVSKRKNSKIANASTAFFTLLPCLAILTYIAALLCAWAPNNYIFSVSISTTTILTTVFGAIAIVYLLIDRMFISKKVMIRPGEIVKRSLSIITTWILLFSFTMPAMSMTVKTKFEDRSLFTEATVDYDASVFGEFALSEEEYASIDNMEDFEVLEKIESAFGNLSENTTKREFLKRQAYHYEQTLLNYSFMGFGGTNYAKIISYIPLVALIATIMATLLLWQNLHSVASEKSPKKGITIPAQFFSIILSIAIVAGVIVFMIVCNFNLLRAELDSGCRVSLSIGAGGIISIISAFIAICIPMEKAKIEEDNYYSRNYSEDDSKKRTKKRAKKDSKDDLDAIIEKYYKSI